MLQDIFLYLFGPYLSLALLLLVSITALVWGVGFSIGFMERYHEAKRNEAERARYQSERSSR